MHTKLIKSDTRLVKTRSTVFLQILNADYSLSTIKKIVIIAQIMQCRQPLAHFCPHILKNSLSIVQFNVRIYKIAACMIGVNIIGTRYMSN